MSLRKSILKRAETRKLRVRYKVKRVGGDKHRVLVFRSNRYISAQLVDGISGKTVVTLTSKALADVKGNNVATAQRVGEEFGKLCLQKGVDQVLFDRSGYLYHGRIKALADGIRSAGVAF